jgi:hypothetical protein
MVNPTVNWSANSGASPGWHLDNVLQSGFSITSTTGNVISSIQWMAVGH